MSTGRDVRPHPPKCTCSSLLPVLCGDLCKRTPLRMSTRGETESAHPRELDSVSSSHGCPPHLLPEPIFLVVAVMAWISPHTPPERGAAWTKQKPCRLPTRLPGTPQLRDVYKSSLDSTTRDVSEQAAAVIWWGFLAILIASFARILQRRRCGKIRSGFSFPMGRPDSRLSPTQAARVQTHRVRTCVWPRWHRRRSLASRASTRVIVVVIGVALLVLMCHTMRGTNRVVPCVHSRSETK